MQILETAQFGLEEVCQAWRREYTVQLALFADGKARVKPLTVFQGNGRQIYFTDKR